MSPAGVFCIAAITVNGYQRSPTAARPPRGRQRYFHGNRPI